MPFFTTGGKILPADWPGRLILYAAEHRDAEFQSLLMHVTAYDILSLLERIPPAPGPNATLLHIFGNLLRHKISAEQMDEYESGYAEAGGRRRTPDEEDALLERAVGGKKTPGRPNTTREVAEYAAKQLNEQNASWKEIEARFRYEYPDHPLIRGVTPQKAKDRIRGAFCRRYRGKK